MEAGAAAFKLGSATVLTLAIPWPAMLLYTVWSAFGGNPPVSVTALLVTVQIWHDVLHSNLS